MNSPQKKPIGPFLLLVGGIVFAAFYSAWPSEPHANAANITPQKSPVQSTKKWIELGKWAGTGTKSTERFDVQGGEFRIHWQAEGEAVSLFQIFVYDEKGSLNTLAANQQGPGKDVTYVRGKPGKYYLTMNTFGLKWAIIAEEER